VSDVWNGKLADADSVPKTIQDSVVNAIDREYSPKFNKAEKKFRGYTAASVILESLGALGFITFGLSFAF
jgi:hypothetical protein